MKRIASLVLLVLGAGCFQAQAQDPGKESIGEIKTELLYVTNGELGDLGKGATALSAEEEKRLQDSKHIPDFKHGVRLGSDRQAILRGYKNWAAPMSNSQAIMVTFQPQGRIGESKRLRMDLELWQNKKMVLRTDPVLDRGKRVYILGPKWREGNLIITVELVSLKDN